MGERSRFCESIWDILSEDLDVLIVGAEIFSGVVLGLEDLHDGLGGCVAIVVGLHLLLLIETGVVENEVLLGQGSLFVLVDLVAVVPAQEGPAIRRHGVRTATAHK